MAYPVLHIANKIIASTDVEHGELISNLKLQKLLYYMQGYFIAVFGKQLFENEIEAWQYGPVIRDVYNHFKSNGSSSINIESGAIIAELNDEEDALFNEVLNEYGQYSAIKLMNMTHEELPWVKTFSENPQGVISNDLMIEYFKTQIIE
ncbi:MAG: Panacea domain-containing protein [Polaribacter sp.]